MGVEDFLAAYYGRYGGDDNPIARILSLHKQASQDAYQQKLQHGQEDTLAAMTQYVKGTESAPKTHFNGGSNSVIANNPIGAGPAVEAVKEQAANPLSSALNPASPLVSMQPKQEEWQSQRQVPNYQQQQQTIPAAAGSGIGAQAVALARTALGTQYKWGGATLNGAKSALDCSGLAQQVYAKLGVTLPRTTYEQAKSGASVGGLANAKPGDLIFYNTSSDPNGIGKNSHVAIYAGNGQMIEAYKTGYPVRVTPVRTANMSTIVRPA